MKRLAIVLSLCALIGAGTWSYCTTASADEKCCATCTGANPCTACKNCSECKYCKKAGNTCGKCKKDKDAI